MLRAYHKVKHVQGTHYKRPIVVFRKVRFEAQVGLRLKLALVLVIVKYFESFPGLENHNNTSDANPQIFKTDLMLTLQLDYDCL